MSPRVLSMSFYNRPEYARQALAALQRCEGVENDTLVACVDPGNDEIRALVEGIDFLDCRRRFNPTRGGANRNIFQCFEEGLRLAEYVVYLEEDTLLAPDALRFFEFCDTRWRADPKVFSVTGYHRSAECDPADYHTVARRAWFHPWGCAVWRDRLAPTFSRWPGPNDLVEVYPLLSRVQNIGGARLLRAQPRLASPAPARPPLGRRSGHLPPSLPRVRPCGKAAQRWHHAARRDPIGHTQVPAVSSR